ncbi:MAG: hypothetical protein IKP73_15150 [Bacteroidales bacterium]|nr:hypothetical protein [Bacteroidales bacterium]
MKQIIIILILMAVCGVASAQTQIHLAWENNGEIITDAVAESDGTDLVPVVDAGVARSLRESYKPVSLVCTFTADELKAMGQDVVTFEVKWYYYMSTRRTFMGVNTVDVDPNKADKDGFVKMVCTKTNPRAGWWEVQIRNKTTDQLVTFAKKTSFSILLK